MLMMRYWWQTEESKCRRLIDRLSETCKAYGMEINVKKTKVMIMNKTEKSKGMQLCIMLDKGLWSK